MPIAMVQLMDRILIMMVSAIVQTVTMPYTVTQIRQIRQPTVIRMEYKIIET